MLIDVSLRNISKDVDSSHALHDPIWAAKSVPFEGTIESASLVSICLAEQINGFFNASRARELLFGAFSVLIVVVVESTDERYSGCAQYSSSDGNGCGSSAVLRTDFFTALIARPHRVIVDVSDSSFSQVLAVHKHEITEAIFTHLILWSEGR